MSRYGVLLGDYDPAKENVYALMVEYFENPTLVKIKDVNQYSMYVARVQCMLYTEYRYVIVFIDKDASPLGTPALLSTLKWMSFQTMTNKSELRVDANSDVRLKPFTYKPKQTGKFVFQIELEKRDKYNETYASTYKVSVLPITVTLIHKTQVVNEYAIKGNLVSALETYNTIINFIKNI